MPKPVLLSGAQPTGRFHLGGYLGALKNWVSLQNSGKYSCYFPIVDLHSLTIDFEPKEKRAQILELAADYMAAGLSPTKSVLFLQSMVPAHSELAWVLNTITPLGELERMTQFKDKILKPIVISGTTSSIEETSPERTIEIVREEVANRMNAGLLTYPVLQAADILLYDTKFVPVGEDQVQHLELTRTLARKFNSRFGNTFVEPQVLLTVAPRVMSLKNPEKKMSKSEPETCLFLDDSPETIRAKVSVAVTDSGSEVVFDKEKKPGVSNLLTIYSAITDTPVQELETRFKGASYRDFKTSLAEAIIEHLAPFRKKKATLLKKPATLVKALRDGSKKAGKAANSKMARVRKALGVTL